MWRHSSLICALTIPAVLFFGCSKDSPTQPPVEQEGSLLLNRLVVSVVPGGNEDVIIHATGTGGTPVSCTITNGNAAVASATLTDSTIHITGLTYGLTNIIVTGAGGKSCTLPVQVYNNIVMDVGDLLITYTSAFERNNTIYWNPIPPEGFHALGTYCLWGGADPNGSKAVMVVKAKPGSDAIAITHTFEGLLPPPDDNVGYWKPIPPSGYTAMGTVLAWHTNADSAACIRDDLTAAGAADDTIFIEYMYGGYSWWRVGEPDTGPHDGAYLAPGTFVIVRGIQPPSAHAVVNVLDVDLPMLAEAPYQDFVPKLTDYDTPPTETAPRLGKAMLVPCTMITDPAHDVAWQVAHSPFYRLERTVYYKLQYHNHNQTSQVQTNDVLIRSGITTTESQRIWNETSISLSVEAGLSFKAFSGKITATVSRNFGYETQSSVTELQEREVSSSINTPPGKAAALWQRFNRYVLYRHNGTALEPVTSWEFGIDSYVTDEYPD